MKSRLKNSASAVAAVWVRGMTPLIYNAMSAKGAGRASCCRKAKKRRAEKATTLKHDPLAEYRGPACIGGMGNVGETRLTFPADRVQKRGNRRGKAIWTQA